MKPIFIPCLLGIIVAAYAGTSKASGLQDSKIKVTDSPLEMTVETSLYTVSFDKTKGYVIASLRDNRSSAVCRFSDGGATVAAEGEHPTYVKRWFSIPQLYRQAEAKVTPELDHEGDSEVTLRLTWTNPLGSAAQTLTFKEGERAIEGESTFEAGKPVIYSSFSLESGEFGSSSREGSLIYPDEKQWAGAGNAGFCAPVPDGKFYYNPEKRIGFGLGTRDTIGTAYLEYLMRGSQEGSKVKRARLALFSRTKRWDLLPSRSTIKFTIQAGGTAAEATSFLNGLVAGGHPVKLVKTLPQKAVYRPNENAITEVTLRNTSETEQTAELVSESVAGSDDLVSVDRRTVQVPPLRQITVKIPWNAGDRLYGLTFRTRLFVAGQEIDRKEDVTSVTDFTPKVAQVAILNPSHNQEGSQPGDIALLRQNYYGILEYYCWMPDEVLDLTPEEEQWHPHTESQGAYEATLSKKFLTTLVKEAAEQGIDTYTMMSSFLSLPNLYGNPELARYTASGQPYLYNGNMYGNRRYAVGPANVFNADFVRKWAGETSASIDMFGWSGSRWDASFIPTIPSDPLALDDQSEVAQANQSKSIWYDSQGTASNVLFPTPDKTGAALLKEWRRTVAENHPEFVYGTNFNATAQTKGLMPEYFKEASTNSLLLLEYLLDPNKEPYNTWEKWARHLTEDAQRVRVNGGQPAVGYMRGFLPGGVALSLSQHLTFASGVHWAGNVGPRHSLDDSWRRFRYALRFSEYFYDPGFLLLPTERRDEVAVQAPDRVFWKQFVYERQLPEKREITVHLLNLPKNDWIVMHHERPESKEAISVSVRLQAGESVKKASLLVPEPSPHAEALQVETRGKLATVHVPRLDTAAIVLVEVNK